MKDAEIASGPGEQTGVMATGEGVGAEGASGRDEVLAAIGARMLKAGRVVLTTHQNADGDGAGSQAAVAAWLEGRGVAVTIVNPTAFPSNLRFLLHRAEVVADHGGEAAREALAGAELVVVLDTSEPNRIAPLDEIIDRARTVVIDHHPPGPTTVGDLALQDATAAATGELVYDLIRVCGGDYPEASVTGIYVAIVSDTGSFRFSNTSARVHRIAAELLSRGVDSEEVFQRLYATFPKRRLDLLREALASLQTDDSGIAWMELSAEVVKRVGATSEDFEGLVDHARSVEGTEVAILFRETTDGHTKLSLRSNGNTDVNQIARRFGGGGHVKAAGAFLEEPPSSAVPKIVEAVRGAITSR